VINHVSVCFSLIRRRRPLALFAGCSGLRSKNQSRGKNCCGKPPAGVYAPRRKTLLVVGPPIHGDVDTSSLTRILRHSGLHPSLFLCANSGNALASSKFPAGQIFCANNKPFAKRPPSSSHLKGPYLKLPNLPSAALRYNSSSEKQTGPGFTSSVFSRTDRAGRGKRAYDSVFAHSPPRPLVPREPIPRRPTSPQQQRPRNSFLLSATSLRVGRRIDLILPSPPLEAVVLQRRSRCLPPKTSRFRPPPPECSNTSFRCFFFARRRQGPIIFFSSAGHHFSPSRNFPIFTHSNSAFCSFLGSRSTVLVYPLFHFTFWFSLD